VLGELSRKLRVICAQDLFGLAVAEGIADVIFSFHEAIRIKQQPIPGDEREISHRIIRTRVHTYEQSIAFNAFQPSAATDAVRFPVCRLCHNGWSKIADRRCWKPIDYGRIQKPKGIEEWPDFGSMFSPP